MHSDEYVNFSGRLKQFKIPNQQLKKLTWIVIASIISLSSAIDEVMGLVWPLSSFSLALKKDTLFLVMQREALNKKKIIYNSSVLT